MKVKDDSEKAGFKLNIQKTKIMASIPILPDKQMGKKSDNSDRFYFLVLQNHCNGDYEITRCLLLGRKAMTNLDSILKSRDITLLTNVLLVKDIVFPVIMYGCEGWTKK